MKPTYSQPEICKVQARYGDFFIPGDDDLIANSIREYGEWAQHEIDIQSAFIRPGDHVVDAGSYIGTHSRAFSALVGDGGQVYAFEPNPDTFSILQRNVAAAAHPNIQLFNIGLGAAKAEVALQIVEASHNRASASVMPAVDAQSVMITVQSLDELTLPKVDFMKVDVEGMELQLLLGAEHTIKHHCPIIFLEVNSLHGSQGFLEWARQHDYLAYGVTVAAFNEQNHQHSSINIFGNAREVGLQLIPMQVIEVHAETLQRLNLPRIESYDDLALLLLHKPQYIEDILGNSTAGTILGLNFPTPSAHSSAELHSLLAAKEMALENASQAYVALRTAFDQKESELVALQAAFDQKELDLVALQAAFDQKELDLVALYNTKKVK